METNHIGKQAPKREGCRIRLKLTRPQAWPGHPWQSHKADRV